MCARAGILGGCVSDNVLIAFSITEGIGLIQQLTGDDSWAPADRYWCRRPKYLQGKSIGRADLRVNTSDSGILGSVNATREVILSVRALNTPKLLKLGGIGPKVEFASFGISLGKNVPGVGTNLQDRYE